MNTPLRFRRVPKQESGTINRRGAIIGAAAALYSVSKANSATLDRLAIVDGWVVKQSEVQTR